MYEKKQFASIEEGQNYATAKAEELSTRLNVKVYPLTFVEDVDTLDIAIGFLKTPIRAVKLQALNMISNNEIVNAGTFLLNACLIKEESDPRIGSEDPAYDAINIGCIMVSSKVVEIRNDISKKK